MPTEQIQQAAEQGVQGQQEIVQAIYKLCEEVCELRKCLTQKNRKAVDDD